MSSLAIPTTPPRAFMCADCGFGASPDVRIRRSPVFLAAGVFVIAFAPLFLTGFVIGVVGALLLTGGLILIAIGIDRIGSVTSRKCAECLSERVVPAESPIGQAMLRQAAPFAGDTPA